MLACMRAVKGSTELSLGIFFPHSESVCLNHTSSCVWGGLAVEKMPECEHYCAGAEQAICSNALREPDPYHPLSCPGEFYACVCTLLSC